MSRGDQVFSGAPAKPTALWGEEEQGSVAEFLPQAETEGSGLCDDEVEEARAGLYREQAEKLRLENEKVGGLE